MNYININGKVITSKGNISISGNKIIIDGADQTPDSKVINIQIDGDVQNLKVDYCERITISGNVGDLQTTSGDVECGNVNGDVTSTSGDIECNNVGRGVKTTSGDVKCGTVSGDVKTLSGDIKHRK